MIAEYLQKPPGTYLLESGFDVRDLTIAVKREGKQSMIRAFSKQRTGFVERMGEAFTIPDGTFVQETRRPRSNGPRNRKVADAISGPSYGSMRLDYYEKAAHANPSGSMNEVANYYDGVWRRLKRRYPEFC